MNNKILSESQLGLSERLINDVFKQVIEQFSKSNNECKNLSEFLIDNMFTLDSISPTQLLKGYNFLSQENNSNDCYKERLEKSFGVDIGTKFYIAMKDKNLLN